MVCFAIALTVVIIGSCKGDKDLEITGVILVILIAFAHAGFQAGAQYQRFLTNENYLLTPKTK